MRTILIFTSFLIVIISLGFFVDQLYYCLIFIHFMYTSYYLHLNKKQLFIIFSIGLLFLLRLVIEEERSHSIINSSQTTFILEIVDQVKWDGNRLSFIGEVKESKEQVIVYYYFSSEKEKLEAMNHVNIGNIYYVTGQLKEPATATNPNAFDYRSYLNKQHIYWQLIINHINFTKYIENQTIISVLKNVRLTMIEKLNTFVPNEIKGVFIALILGERFYIEEELNDSYEKLGVVHLLAISGLHVSLLFGMIFFLLIRIGIPKEHAQIIILVSLPAYAILTGLSPSVVRACAMLFIILLAKKGQYSLNSMECLLMIFLLYVFIRPFILVNIGFQLSFLITFCILLSSHILQKRTFLNQLATVTFICQLASIPLQVYYFYEFSFLSFIANLLLIPLYSWVYLPLFSIFSILHFLNFSLAPIYFLLVKIISFLDEITKKLAADDFFSVNIGTFSVAWLIILYVFTFALFICWDRRKQTKKVMILLLATYVFIFFWNKASPIGEVTMLDVGQGDSIYIQLPFSQGTYLIDTGGTIRWQEEEWKKRKTSFEVGNDIIVPFLKSKGQYTIDKLILTHFDYDHVGGIFSILEQRKVRELVIPAYHPENEWKEKIIQICKDNMIKISYVKHGDYWLEGKNEFLVLNPKNTNQDANNSSIVMLAKIGQKRWLFTGDAEEIVENQIVNDLANQVIDVLKIGHHGSNSSTTSKLLNHIKIDQAWISVGGNNKYGHPTTQVLDRLKDRQIKVYRTDKNGSISYKFLGNRGTFWCMKP